jgi:23S rRNA pseudouridine1911/1915/1917 synthase
MLALTLAMALFKAQGFVPKLQCMRVMTLSARVRSKATRGGGRRRPGRNFRGENRVKYIHKGEVEQDHPSTLLEYVINVFPDVKRTQAKQWLSFGALMINDETTKRYDHKLEVGDVVLVRSGHIHQERVGLNRHGLPSGVKVLYEDEDILALSKPAGMVANNGGNKEESKAHASNKSLQQHANTYLARKWERQRGKAGTQERYASVSLAHHVDAECSGVVLFAKSKEVQAYLQSQWNTFGMTYVGVVEGRLSPLQGDMHCRMEEARSGTMSASAEVESALGGQRKSMLAKSVYRTLQAQVTRTLAVQTSMGGRRKNWHHRIVEVSPLTRVRDQVRCQLAFVGVPVVGDVIYTGSSRNNSQSGAVTGTGSSSRLYLHVAELKIAKPHNGSDLTITSEVPPEFENLLSVLKKRSEATTRSGVSKNNPGGGEEGDGWAHAGVTDNPAGVTDNPAGVTDNPAGVEEMQARDDPRVVTLEDFLGGPVVAKPSGGRGRRRGSRSEPPLYGSSGEGAGRRVRGRRR